MTAQHDRAPEYAEFFYLTQLFSWLTRTEPSVSTTLGRLTFHPFEIDVLPTTHTKIKSIFAPFSGKCVCSRDVWQSPMGGHVERVPQKDVFPL